MRRASLLLIGVFLLSACGFSPVYGPKGGDRAPVAAALSNVAIENIPNEEGQSLRNKLIDRMYRQGRPAKPAARLSVTVTGSETELGIQKDATATVIELTMNAPYILRSANGQELLNGNAKSLVLYSKLNAQYGTLAAKRNAYDRALTEISEQILNRLSLFYAETPPAKEAPRADEKPVSPGTSWAFRTH